MALAQFDCGKVDLANGYWNLQKYNSQNIEILLTEDIIYINKTRKYTHEVYVLLKLWECIQPKPSMEKFKEIIKQYTLTLNLKRTNNYVQ